MRTFDGPFPLDFLFLRTAGDKHILSMPLCEGFVAVNGVLYDPKLSNESTIAFIERVENGKQMKFNRDEFRLKIQHDVYENKTKVMDFVIQPEGEMLTAETSAFLERYNF